MITYLEKVEGKCISYDILEDSIPRLDSQGVYNQTCRQHRKLQLKHLCMASRLVFIVDNHHFQNRPRLIHSHSRSDRLVRSYVDCFRLIVLLFW